MKISVNAGHSTYVAGAGKYIQEVPEAAAVASALVSELKARGHDARLAPNVGRTQSAYLREEYGHSNNMGADLAISIHFNAGGGTGTEVLYNGSVSASWARKISPAVASALGLKNRGAKSRTNLAFLNSTKMPAVLVEVCFVDTQADVTAYKRIGAAGVARAIANAITPQASSTPKKEEPAPQTQQEEEGMNAGFAWSENNTQWNMIINTNSGFITKWQQGGGTYGDAVAKAFGTTYATITPSHARAIVASIKAMNDLKKA